jgi:hypothetical protein
MDEAARLVSFTGTLGGERPYILARANVYIDFGLFLHLASWLFDVYLKFAIDLLDVDFAMFGNVGQEDAQAEGNRQQAFDGAAQRTRSLRLAKALFAEQINSTISRV